MLTGNKGEWSEVYTFLKLLGVGKLYAADENLRKVDNVFYNILEIIRSESIGNLEFRYSNNQNDVEVVNTDSGNILISMPKSEFDDQANKLFSDIIHSVGTTFSFAETEAFLNTVAVQSLKASSSDKSDIKIKVHDINSGYEAVQGFSIKSRLGNPSTLVNAGRTTNFIYEVKNATPESVEEYNGSEEIFKNKLGKLCSSSAVLDFVGMENRTFYNNLVLIDSMLPSICAEMLLEYYVKGNTTVKAIVESVTEHNPLHFDIEQSGHPFYEYKFKKFLRECALGMLPGRKWDGTIDATGGYIIVREDGEVLCYHLFNINEFEKYLLMNTKFETASTSRHGFGKIYEENGKFYIKLNLQVRFIR